MFDYNDAPSETQKENMRVIREMYTELEALIRAKCPESRLRSEALTDLEHSGMFAIKSISHGPK